MTKTKQLSLAKFETEAWPVTIGAARKSNWRLSPQRRYAPRKIGH